MDLQSRQDRLETTVSEATCSAGEALSEKDAEDLWTAVRQGLVNVENAIRDVIRARAWEPLGYRTFSEAWADRMTGVALANSVKPYVIYAMLDEGLEAEDVAESTGWGLDQVETAARDHSAGVPPEAATVVRRHLRRLPYLPRHVVHVDLSHEDYVAFKKTCRDHGLDFKVEAERAIVEHFAALSGLQTCSDD
jgi:hypothetical protein